MRLYHYCSSVAALSILRNRSIRLSPLSNANDTLEGRVLGQVFRRLVDASGLSEGVRSVASIIAEGYPDATEGFAFCLSEADDLLSQWRAYADDGHGFAIGFDAAVLASHFEGTNFGSHYFELKQVGYGQGSLALQLQPLVDQLVQELGPLGEFVALSKKYSRDEALRRLADRTQSAAGLFVARGPEGEATSDRLLALMRPLHFKVYDTKPEAFSEEREWRLLRYRHRAHFQEISYLADSSGIRPYIECQFGEHASSAVCEMIVGPRNNSDVGWLRAFLSSVGLEAVDVRRSSVTSYR